MQEEELKQLLNKCLNDAVKAKVKRDSNSIAEFINNWIKRK